MKTKRFVQILAIVLLATINHQLSTCLAQGSLTPAGTPAPTMKSLAQIEPRTPIAAAPFTISVPGSYYLMTNLVCTVSNAIAISASGVTLDLNGFTISSTVANAANGGAAILLGSGLRNVTVANGFIQGGVTNNGGGVYSGRGFGYGIFYSGNPPVNVLVSRVSVTGCLYNGIYLGLGYSTVMESCNVATCGSFGIMASTIKQSSAIDCGSYAIFGDEVSDCEGQATDGEGITATTAQNCVGHGTGGVGLYALNAQNCYGYSDSSFAIYADTAQGCEGYSSGNGSGVVADSIVNCYGYSSGNGNGVSGDCVVNCYGTSGGSGIGVVASYIASGCHGISNSGTGVSAFIASVCHGSSALGFALSTPHNVNSY